jgi:PAS domain S-box-containing protein
VASVLYYDPDPAWRERVGQADGADGIAFAPVATLGEALAILRDGAPDAVVADPPYTIGLPLLSLARRHCGAVPVVLFLTPGREHDAVEFLNGGADRCVEKGDDSLLVFLRTLRHLLAERAGVALREHQADQLEFLSRSAMDFVGMEDDADIYRYIADRVAECAPGAWVGVSSYDPVSGLFTLRALAASEHDRKVFDEELPWPMIGQSYSMEGTPSAMVALSCQSLIDAPSSFYVLTAGTVPEEICARIDQRLTPGRAYSMSFACRGGVYGVVTFRFRKGMELGNRELIQAFIGQASVALLRRHARQRLLESEARYRAVVESQHELVCRFRPDGTHLFANEAYCRFFDLDPATVTGARFAPEVPAEERDGLREYFRGFAPGRPDGMIEHRVRLPDRGVRWLQWSDRAFFDRDGLVEEFQSVGRDVTERKEAEVALAALTTELEERVETATAELRAANRDLEAFSHHVSHDLRAPMRAIDGYLGMLMGRFGPEMHPDAVVLVGKARMGVSRADRFLEGLLSLSRLSHRPLAVEEVETGAIVRAVLGDLLPDPRERRVEVTVGPLPRCCADAEMLRHIYQNLISNALKFTRTRDPARIELNGVARRGETAFSVADNGIGFPPDGSPRIFEEFARLHDAREYEGSGIGLALVKRIVERHGGRCRAVSSPGTGATFFFTLPDA